MAKTVRAVALTGSNQVIDASTAAYYCGFSIRETSGSATATVRIYDNPTTGSGTLLETIQLLAGESRGEWYGPDGIDTADGIEVTIVAGAVEGSIRVAR